MLVSCGFRAIYRQIWPALPSHDDAARKRQARCRPSNELLFIVHTAVVLANGRLIRRFLRRIKASIQNGLQDVLVYGSEYVWTIENLFTLNNRGLRILDPSRIGESGNTCGLCVGHPYTSY